MGRGGEAPLAIVARVKNALRLVALDEAAERLGLTRGMALADARAMIPALGVADDDPERRCHPRRGGRRLGRALHAAGRPGLDQRPGAGSRHHRLRPSFRRRNGLAADCVARLAHQGFAARAAIADTPGAAVALARYGSDSVRVVPPGGAAAALKALPLAALRLAPETVAALDRVGLKSIGQIAGAPRAPLVARFGAMLVRRLDQALGHDEEAISPRRPAAVLLAERRFAEPIGLEEDVAATLASLAATTCQTMETQGVGARLIELALFRVDGVVSRILVGTGRPLRAPKRIAALFREKFAQLGDDLDAGFGFDMVRLAVAEAAPLSAAQIDLDGDGEAESDLDGLIDRIGARLGSRAVGRLTPGDSHIPERAEAFAAYSAPDQPGDLSPLEQKVPAIGSSGRAEALLSPEGEEDASRDAASELIARPLRLFARPEPVEAIAEIPDGPPARFRWRRTLYRVARAEGPERIAAEWWRDDDLTRDYFRVEDLTGHRFWLFREGLYGRETNTPRWYLHGVFA